MSEGQRLSLQFARDAAKRCCALWGMASPACGIVGSVRRGQPDVGDLEMIAPLPEGWEEKGCKDPLWDAIEASFTSGGLFDTKPPELVGRIVSGQRGFKACSVEFDHVHVATGECAKCPVQIFRYLPGEKGNRGWIEIMRTGPADFGKAFLIEWKKQHKRGDAPGSKDGMLLGQYGEPVPTPDEETCFRILGWPNVPPKDRK